MNIFYVIPAEAGIQKALNSLDSGFRPAPWDSSGMTALSDCDSASKAVVRQTHHPEQCRRRIQQLQESLDAGFYLPLADQSGMTCLDHIGEFLSEQQ